MDRVTELLNANTELVEQVRFQKRHAAGLRMLVDLLVCEKQGDTALPPPEPRNGRMIVLEGCEFTGKSTQAAKLARWAEGQGHKVVQTREPGGSQLAEDLRAMVKSRPMDAQLQLMLFMAARWDHLTTVVYPALRSGSWVICDRFTDSTAVYQGAIGRAGIHTVLKMNALMFGDFKPDLTVVLDAPVPVLMARKADRDGNDHFDNLPVEQHMQMRQLYQALAARDPSRYTVVDAAADPEQVHRRVRDAVIEQMFGAKEYV